MQNATHHNTTEALSIKTTLQNFSLHSLRFHPSWPSQQRLSLNNTRSLSLSPSPFLCFSNLGFSYLETKLFLFVELINRQQNLVMVLILSWFVLSGFFRGFGFSCEAKKVTFNDFNIGKPLGRGKFGHVYLAREKTVSFQLFLNFLSQITIIWHCVIGGWVLGTMFIVYCCFACAFHNIHFVGKKHIFLCKCFPSK